MSKNVCLFAVVLALIALAGCSPAPTGASTPTLGSALVSPVDGMTMVYVPEGEFKMGSEAGMTDERPLHTVFLDAFWLDQTEITNEMYGNCVGAGQCKEPNSTVYFDDPAYANHPVASVSWVDAGNYCAWAGRRLPTEAEWEKAASWDPIANEQRVYPWGNEYDCTKGNFDDEIQLDASLMPDTAPNCDGFAHSSPVGSFPEGASAYGALDMGGNVWEWVNDAFIEVDPINASIQNYYAVSPASNPQGVDPAITDYRGMRGGSWNFTFGFGRAAYRLWYGLDDSYDGVGFRCASSITP
ncbi:MAG: formylglycine-generating enzyme family protein [Chloroflexi bacterium]|nr:formylglycine-generating enzyme family protein [Chloroflexota bacterium]